MMKTQALKELLPDYAAHPLASLRLGGLCLDSRYLEAGDAFVALPGELGHGLDYLSMARERGAVCVLSDRAPADASADVVVIPDLVARLSALAQCFYDDPSAHLRITGVTGTNGKSTCAHLMMQVLNACGETAGMIGTIGWGLPQHWQTATHTTADVLSNQRMLAAMRASGANSVAMEVSSHALAQGRTDGVRIQTAIFTNLSHDHLDYHGTLSAYGEAKRKLFAHPTLRHAILNADDPYSSTIAATLSEDVQLLRYTCERHDAEVGVGAIDLEPDGIHASIHSPWGQGQLSLPMLGRYNLGNALAVLTAACVQGQDFTMVLNALSRVVTVPGRLQRVDVTGGPMTLIDYAHTPDALDKVLRAVREHVSGRLWCVFGCGGDRDRAKRPLMGRIAHEAADALVITSDNPRTESPMAIIREIATGVPVGTADLIEDRERAIRSVVQWAAPEDVILIAGKGHEDYQEIDGVRYPFSDALVAREALERRYAA